ncbi:hypothetical protein AB0M95_14235 [Sphaerisporangium sp. NPDC051017]|uniref:plasmid mobilization protein n=1 Tax=Sphaerisporangium sp. NPDC051017 TaxID=3154636 RepID=UPI00344AA236
MIEWPAFIEWDERNEVHATGHGVSAIEIEQVLWNGPTYRLNKRHRSGDYIAVGHTDGGRHVAVVVRMGRSNEVSPADHRVGAVMKDPDQMSEAELAEFYYADRDDSDVLGEEVLRTEPSRLSSMVSVRFTPEETVLLRRAAEEAGLTLSSYIRRCALTASDRPVDIDRVRRDVEEAGRRLSDALRVLHVRQAS